LRSYLNEKSSGSRFRKQRLTAVGTRCADHVTSPTGGGRSVGIVRVRTKATESHYRPGTGPEGSRRLRLPDFKRVGT